MTTRYHVASTAITKEKRFYDDADTVNNEIETFRRKLRARNEEFDLLLEYYERHRGVIDVYNRPVNGPRAARANLGTRDQSWYYLDGKGNKIWVRDMKLDTTDPRSGAFSGSENADGRIVVVEIPRVRKNFTIKEDYTQKIAEFDGSYRLPCSHRQSSAASRSNVAPMMLEGEGGTANSVEKYIAAQQSLGQGLESVRPEQRPEYVWRPPATLEEAEERLAQLKREAEVLERERRGQQQ